MHYRYLRAFGKQYPSRYMYLTDVGTTADKHCLPRLVNYMDKNTDYVAVTGFQRVQVGNPCSKQPHQSSCHAAPSQLLLPLRAPAHLQESACLLPYQDQSKHMVDIFRT